MIKTSPVIVILLLLASASSLKAQDKFYNYYERGQKYMEAGDWYRAIEEIRASISIEFEEKKNKRTYGTHFIEYYPHRELGVALFQIGDMENARKELELSIAYDKSKRAQEYLGKITGENLLLADFEKQKANEEKKTSAQEALIVEQLKKKEQEKATLDETQKGLAAQAQYLDEVKKKKEAELAEELRRIEEKKKQEVSEKEKKALQENERKLKAEKDQLEKEKELMAAQKAEQEKALFAKQAAIEKQQQDLQAEREKLRAESNAFSAKRAKSGSGLPSGALTYDPTKVTQVGSRLALAVLPFSTKGKASAGSESVTEKMITQLVNLRRFKVIERGAVDQVIKEQNFGLSEMVDENTAVKVGKIAGADAIVLGSVNLETGFAKVSARVIDTETSETIVAREEQTDNTSTASVESLVEKVAVSMYNDLPLVEGYVVSVEGDIIYLDIGTSVGVRKGSKCVAFREGDPIKHPVTKEVLGRRVTKLAELVVIEVQDKLSVSKIVGKTEGDIKLGDRVVVK